jgi:hypothetical protein
MTRLVAALLATAIVAGPAAAEPRKLDMAAFFSGRTHSENVLKIAFKQPKRLIVDSVGRVEGKDLVLIDTVREEGEAVRIRKWVMRPTGPNGYTGTLSDALGPVQVQVAGDTATIRYVMKSGLKVEQKLQLRADGKSLSNQTVAKKFGMKFARVEGTVRKLD